MDIYEHRQLIASYLQQLQIFTMRISMNNLRNDHTAITHLVPQAIELLQHVDTHAAACIIDTANGKEEPCSTESSKPS